MVIVLRSIEAREEYHGDRPNWFGLSEKCF
jgi:hypothetical protein